jgi:hypothetical protein
MAKKFMFVCVGILALTVAFLLGAQFGRAEYVDHSTSGIVAEISGRVLLDNGEVWNYDDSQFRWFLVRTLPVPISTIKFWSLERFVTDANEVWRLNPGEPETWFNEGSPPGGGPTPTQPSTWGSIKAQFK